MAAAAWMVVVENGLVEEEHGMRVSDLWSITVRHTGRLSLPLVNKDL